MSKHAPWKQTTVPHDDSPLSHELSSELNELTLDLTEPSLEPSLEPALETSPRHPRLKALKEEVLVSVVIENYGKKRLPIDELKRNEELFELVERGLLCLPVRQRDIGSKMAPCEELSFEKMTEHRDLYETLKDCGDWSQQTPSQALEILTALLGCLAQLEDVGCPTLSLDHSTVWCQNDSDELCVWAARPYEGGWPEAASVLISQLLLLCQGMGSDQLPSAHELLSVLDVLLDTLPPRQLAVLERGLRGEFSNCYRLQEAFEDAAKALQPREVIGSFERVATQLEGVEKYRKRHAQHLSLDRQQEDRLYEASFSYEGQSFWLGAVLDGVSSCDFGSGAQIAEAGRRGIHNALSLLPKHEQVAELFRERGAEVILDFVQRSMEKEVRLELEELCQAEGLEINQPSVRYPTSTMSLALIDERGALTLKWVGDSPVMILTQPGELVKLCQPHTELLKRVSDGDELEYALSSESASSLTSDLSSLSLGFSDQVEHRSAQLLPGETLLLCSDGLIDGFKVDQRKGSEARALQAIEAFIEEQQQANDEHNISLYRLVKGLGFEADRRRGVDNISLLAARPLWRAARSERLKSELDQARDEEPPTRKRRRPGSYRGYSR